MSDREIRTGLRLLRASPEDWPLDDEELLHHLAAVRAELRRRGREEMACVLQVGTYSSRHIVAVTLDQDEAESVLSEWQRLRQGERDAGRPVDYNILSPDITHWALNGDPARPDGRYQVLMDINGDTPRGHSAMVWQECEEDEAPDEFSTPEHWPPGAMSNTDLDCFAGWGPTGEHARRSADQLRREFLVANPDALRVAQDPFEWRDPLVVQTGMLVPRGTTQMAMEWSNAQDAVMLDADELRDETEEAIEALTDSERTPGINEGRPSAEE